MGRKPKELPETRRQIMNKHLKKRTYQSYIWNPVGHITKIVSKIHRIILTGNIIFNELNEILGPLKENKRFPYSKKNKDKGYKKMYDGSKDGFKYQVFRYPLKTGMPKILIQINPPEGVSIRKYKSFLTQLNTPFPNLGLSKVEYTIDLYCKDYMLAKLLFDVLSRTLFVPWVRNPPTIYAESFSTGKMKNRTMEISDEIIVYERGDDKDKTREGWEEVKINRVRLEYKPLKEKLTGKDLYKLSDFIISCKFYELNKDVWQFKKFEGSNRLPGELDFYLADGTYQGEYIANRKIKKIPKKYRVDVEELARLKDELLDAMRSYDVRWEALV